MYLFLSFAKDNDSCRFLDLYINSIIEARDVEFVEKKFIKDKVLSLKDIPENAKNYIAPDESISPEAEGVNAEEETLKVVEPPSKNIRKQKNFGDNFITYNIEGDSQTFQKAI